MSCANSDPNFCDIYCTVLNERKNLEQQCLDRANIIEETEITTIDERRKEAKLKFPHIYSEYTKQLKDKVEVLKMIAQNMLEDLLRDRNQHTKVEEIVELQTIAIDKLERENQLLETGVNKEIVEIRKNFTEKWKALNEAKQKFEATKKKLEEMCKTENDIEKEILAKKLERKQTLCAIKAIRPESGEKVTLKMFDKLGGRHKKLLKLFSEAKLVGECFRGKICQTEREMNVIRRFSKQQFEIIKQHNEWGLEKLSIRKLALEEAIFKASDEFKSVKTGNLQSELCMSGKHLEDLRETTENFKCLVENVAKKASICKKVIKPSLKGKPKFRTAKKIRATDYLGSAFVKLEPILK